MDFFRQHLFIRFLWLALLAACSGTDDDFDCDRRNTDLTAESASFSFRYESSVLDTNSIPPILISPLEGFQYPCFRDSVVMLKEDGTIAEGSSLESDGKVRFRVTTFDEDHSDAFINEQVRTFYLYVNYLEIDTFRFEYKMLQTDCGYTPFEYASIYWNDEFQYQVTNQPTLGSPDITLDSLAYNPCPD